MPLKSEKHNPQQEKNKNKLKNTWHRPQLFWKDSWCHIYQ